MLEVPQRDGPAHQVLVHGLHQVHGRDLPVHQGLPEDAAAHVEVPQMEVVRDAGIRVDLHAHLVDGRVQEEPAVRVEELLADDGVELAGDAAGVQGGLPDELEAEDLGRSARVGEYGRVLKRAKREKKDKQRRE